MSKKVLLIEDDINILLSLLARFTTLGLNVSTNNGTSEISEIINQIIKEKADYIILDVILPKINGFDLLYEIKSRPEIKSTIFVFTNLSDKDGKERSEKLGADYYFIKNDFNIDEFIEKINKIIKNREKI